MTIRIFRAKYQVKTGRQKKGWKDRRKEGGRERGRKKGRKKTQRLLCKATSERVKPTSRKVAQQSPPPHS